MKEAVIVFGKPATAGEVKTRLCPPLSPEQAARLYDAFARDVLETVHRYRGGRRKVRAILAWAGTPEDPLAAFAVDELNFELIDQGDGDLGSRLQRVSTEVRQRGVDSMIIVGTDSPTLTPDHLQTAALRLQRSDVVFGPSFDGGYYLVGLGGIPDCGIVGEDVIFEEISWSSTRVLAQSWRRAQGEGLLCDLMGFWYDIDTFEDLKKAYFHLFEFWTSRDPLVGQNTRQFLELNPIDQQIEG